MELNRKAYYEKWIESGEVSTKEFYEYYAEQLEDKLEAIESNKVAEFSGKIETQPYYEDFGGMEFHRVIGINNFCTEDSNVNGDLSIIQSSCTSPSLFEDNEEIYTVTISKEK